LEPTETRVDPSRLRSVQRLAFASAFEHFGMPRSVPSTPAGRRMSSAASGWCPSGAPNRVTKPVPAPAWALV
jgi:hypothetical protein